MDKELREITQANITAAILCGGKSSRMGREKAFSFLNNKPIFEYVLDILTENFNQIVISTNNKNYFKKYNLPIIEDIIPDKDSIGGIYSVLNTIKTKYAFIVACDMPFIEKNAIQIMIKNIDNYDIVMPKIKGRFQPFFAIYSKNSLPIIYDNIKSNKLKIAFLLDRLKVKILTEEYFSSVNIEKNFFNINTEEDLENASNGIFKDLNLIAIVAKYSNSGKTTLLTNLIKLFKNDMFKIAVIKNTFHNIEFDKKGKDSYKFYEAGADTVVVNSKDEIIIRKKINNQFPIKYIRDYYLRDMDIILLEGHKTGNFLKIEVTKDKQKEFLFEKDKNVIAVVSNDELNTTLPQFKHNDYEKLYNFIKEKCLK